MVGTDSLLKLLSRLDDSISLYKSTCNSSPRAAISSNPTRLIAYLQKANELFRLATLQGAFQLSGRAHLL